MGTKKGVDGVALSADGHVLIAASNHIVKVWEVPAGKELWHFKDEHGAGLARVAISPAGEMAAHRSPTPIPLHDAGPGQPLHQLFYKRLGSGLCVPPASDLVVA